MNRETYPGTGFSPSGDVVSSAGSTALTVVGLQRVPINSTASFSGGELLMYNGNLGAWVPNLRATIQVDGVTVSDDWVISVNIVKPVLADGV